MLINGHWWVTWNSCNFTAAHRCGEWSRCCRFCRFSSPHNRLFLLLDCDLNLTGISLTIRFHLNNIGRPITHHSAGIVHHIRIACLHSKHIFTIWHRFAVQKLVATFRMLNMRYRGITFRDIARNWDAAHIDDRFRRCTVRRCRFCTNILVADALTCVTVVDLNDLTWFEHLVVRSNTCAIGCVDTALPITPESRRCTAHERSLRQAAGKTVGRGRCTFASDFQKIFEVITCSITWNGALRVDVAFGTELRWWWCNNFTATVCSAIRRAFFARQLHRHRPIARWCSRVEHHRFATALLQHNNGSILRLIALGELVTIARMLLEIVAKEIIALVPEWTGQRWQNGNDGHDNELCQFWWVDGGGGDGRCRRRCNELLRAIVTAITIHSNLVVEALAPTNETLVGRADNILAGFLRMLMRHRWPTFYCRNVVAQTEHSTRAAQLSHLQVCWQRFNIVDFEVARLWHLDIFSACRVVERVLVEPGRPARDANLKLWCDGEEEEKVYESCFLIVQEWKKIELHQRVQMPSRKARPSRFCCLASICRCDKSRSSSHRPHNKQCRSPLDKLVCRASLAHTQHTMCWSRHFPQDIRDACSPQHMSLCYTIVLASVDPSDCRTSRADKRWRMANSRSTQRRIAWLIKMKFERTHTEEKSERLLCGKRRSAKKKRDEISINIRQSSGVRHLMRIPLAAHAWA